MPPDLTIFAAKYLVFLDAACAAALLIWLLWARPRDVLLRWVVAVVIMVIVSYVAAQVGAALYTDPRPFTQDHVKPLIAHAADNGFPSDHALLAAAIVAAVFLASEYWALPFVFLAILVDWARVGAGIHHVIDVVGSSVCVAIGLAVAMLVAPPIARALLKRLPIPQEAAGRQ